MIVNASSKRSIRWSNGKPKARNSVSFQPAPRPRIRRPPLISSIVGGLLGEQRRVVEVRARDERPELHAGRRGGDGRHRGPRLPRAARRPVGPSIEEVLADPDRVVAEVLDGADHVEDLRPADLALDLGQLDADLERDGRARVRCASVRAGGSQRGRHRAQVIGRAAAAGADDRGAGVTELHREVGHRGRIRLVHRAHVDELGHPGVRLRDEDGIGIGGVHPLR